MANGPSLFLLFNFIIFGEKIKNIIYNKDMKNWKLHKTFIKVAIVVCLILAAIVAIIYFTSKKPESKKISNEKSAATLSYIKELESIDVAPIENQIFENNKQKLILEDDIAPDKVFRNLTDLGTVILGDSRASGFSEFNFMDRSRVLATIGGSIYNIPSFMPELQNLNPKNIIISYGLNEIPYYMDPAAFAESNKTFVNELLFYMSNLKAQFPNANIYFSSILPVTDAVVAERSGYAIIPSRNAAIEKMCKENGFHFIDITPYANANIHMYGADGMHVFPEFYPIWGKVLLNAVTNRESVGKVDDMTDDEVWAMLEHYNVVLAGDSRGAEASAFGFYPQYLNYSGYSRTIYDIPLIYDNVATYKPRHLILCYGVNDLGLFGGFGVEKYMTDLHNFVNQLKEISPTTTVYINSIPPSLPSEYDRAPNWALAYPWNEYNEAYCKEHGLNYINITSLCDAHQDLYRGDGVHFQPAFYPLWARTILKEVMKHER